MFFFSLTLKATNRVIFILIFKHLSENFQSGRHSINERTDFERVSIHIFALHWHYTTPALGDVMTQCTLRYVALVKMRHRGHYTTPSHIKRIEIQILAPHSALRKAPSAFVKALGYAHFSTQCSAALGCQLRQTVTSLPVTNENRGTTQCRTWCELRHALQYLLKIPIASIFYNFCIQQFLHKKCIKL